MHPLPFSKPCEIEDFAHRGLAPLLGDGAGPVGKWEVAMAIRALRRFGGVRPGAAVLAVVPQVDDVVRQLRPTVASVSMATPFIGRTPPMADGAFDAVYCARTVEHLGDLQDASESVIEMARVLRPGGVLTLSTRLRLAGPPGGTGWPRMHRSFPPDHLERFVVAASGLELVDGLQLSISEATLSSPRRLRFAIPGYDAAVTVADDVHNQDGYAGGDGDQLIEVEGGYVSTTVHLAMVKTEGPSARRPRPASTTMTERRRWREPRVLDAPSLPPPRRGSAAVLSDGRAALTKQVTAMDDAYTEAERRLGECRWRLEDVDRNLSDLRDAGRRLELDLSRMDPGGTGAEACHPRG